MTHREIARELGVSAATLSLIINNKPGISDVKRKYILGQLENMGYGHLIKMSKDPDNNNFCFVVYKKKHSALANHASYSFFMEIIQKKALQYGYNLFFMIIDEEKPFEMQLNSLINMNTKGMVLYATEMRDEDLKVFDAYKEPMIVIDNEFTREKYNTINTNFEMAGFQAIEYLVRMGHTRIGYMKSKTSFWCFEERANAYEKVAQEYNIPFRKQDIWNISVNDVEQTYLDIVNQIKTATELPTAFVTDEDSIAFGALRALREVGIKVPDDISIIGFNNRSACNHTMPPLTTIDIKTKNFASRTVEELVRLVENRDNQIENNTFKIRLETSLVERLSVANILQK